MTVLKSILDKAMAEVTDEEVNHLAAKWMLQGMEITDRRVHRDTIPLEIDEQAYLDHIKEITYCIDPDWMPFEWINEQGHHEEMAADLMGEVQKRTRRPGAGPDPRDLRLCRHRPTIDYQLCSRDIKDLMIGGKLDIPLKLSFAARKDEPRELLSILNKALDNISGEEKKLIADKWFSIKIERDRRVQSPARPFPQKTCRCLRL
jgi:hypothetical protein